MSETTSIDLTPDVTGLIAFARRIQRGAAAGSKDAATAAKILLECGIDPNLRISEPEFRRGAPTAINGIEILELTRFNGGSIADGVEAAATALTRTHGQFSTHTLIRQSEDGTFFLNAGHYNLRDEATARADAATRSQA